MTETQISAISIARMTKIQQRIKSLDGGVDGGHATVQVGQ